MSDREKFEKERQVIIDEFPEMEFFTDQELKEKTIAVMASILHESSYERMSECPFYKDVPKRYNMETHVRHVVNNCMQMADNLEKFSGVTCRRDLLLSAAFLHDGSKILEREGPEGTVSEMGKHLIHSQYAGVRCWEYGLPPEVAYIVSYHTFTPPHVHINPKNIEFVILSWADIGGADAVFYAYGKPTHLQISKRFFEVQ